MSSSSYDDPLGADFIVSVVALVLSVTALLSTVLLALQHYATATSEAYARCGPRYMGQWSRYTRRLFRPAELRFEIQFETPVIFLAPPNNIRKPIMNQPLYYIGQADMELEKTGTWPPIETLDWTHEFSEKPRLTEKQLVRTSDDERASWVNLLMEIHRMESESRDWEMLECKSNGPSKPPPGFMERTLAIGIQPKRRSWDAMPSYMTKPYATTTLSNVVELAAFLGMYWKQFCRDTDRYRAEGNGYTLQGSVTNDLRLIFTFQKSGRSIFRDNRVIPASEITMLCFGFVPSIFNTSKRRLESRLQFPDEDLEDLTILRLGSDKEIAKTINALGCNRQTVGSFEEGKPASHLFPVIFELIGMLGRSIYIPGSYFRMIPNPTIYPWRVNHSDRRRLMEAFQTNIGDWMPDPITSGVRRVMQHAETILRSENSGARAKSHPSLLALQDALDSADSYLTQSTHKQMVVKILAVHIQTVMKYLEPPTYDSNAPFLLKLLDLDTPAHRPTTFMNYYFEYIREEVVQDFCSSESTYEERSLPKKERATYKKSNTIWCVLVFRMLCWLILHDFNEDDVQIPKSESFGSLAPVYIT